MCHDLSHFLALCDFQHFCSLISFTCSLLASLVYLGSCDSPSIFFSLFLICFPVLCLSASDSSSIFAPLCLPSIPTCVACVILVCTYFSLCVFFYSVVGYFFCLLSTSLYPASICKHAWNGHSNTICGLSTYKQYFLSICELEPEMMVGWISLISQINPQFSFIIMLQRTVSHLNMTLVLKTLIYGHVRSNY